MARTRTGLTNRPHCRSGRHHDTVQVPQRGVQVLQRVYYPPIEGRRAACGRRELTTRLPQSPETIDETSCEPQPQCFGHLAGFSRQVRACTEHVHEHGLLMSSRPVLCCMLRSRGQPSRPFDRHQPRWATQAYGSTAAIHSRRTRGIAGDAARGRLPPAAPQTAAAPAAAPSPACGGTSALPRCKPA